jgi:hypothetical protein
MKTLIRLMPIILFLTGIIGLSSCEKKNTDNSSKGILEISLNIPDETSSSKSYVVIDSSGVVSHHLMISIEDMEGNNVMSDSLIPLYTFGADFISEKVELKTGEYRLTKFMVINPSGEVVFAAPVEGSPLAYLVNRPLPLTFSIFPDQVTRIVPEVLAVRDQTPDQFGYANFGIQIIMPLHFWAICILDNPLSMAPTQLTTAKLTVYAENRWHYTFNLEAGTNHLIIRGGSPVYYFLLEKEGYMPQKMEFTARQLMTTTREYPLVLKIPWDSTIIWSENFETYDAKTFPNTWIPDGNGTDFSSNYIDNTIFYEGNKSFKLFGAIGSCWAAIGYHNLKITPPFTVELAVRNGDEILSGCNPDRVKINLRQGTSWTHPERVFTIFRGNGKIYGGGGKELGSYKTNVWYLFRIRYEKPNSSTVKLSYWLDKVYLGDETMPIINAETLLDNFEVCSLEGSSWFDNIKIFK